MSSFLDPDLVNKMEFIDGDEQALMAKFQMGEQVKDFLKSPAGRYLYGRAKQDFEQAKTDLMACDTEGFFGSYFSRRKVRKIKERAAVSRAFRSWCVEAIQEGENAQVEFENYRQ